VTEPDRNRFSYRSQRERKFGQGKQKMFVRNGFHELFGHELGDAVLPMLLSSACLMRMSILASF
jgi:hypothetical protein